MLLDDQACLFSMQTLMDADKRAAYDALMGFTSGAINPFNDSTHAADKVTMPWHHMPFQTRLLFSRGCYVLHC